MPSSRRIVDRALMMTPLLGFSAVITLAALVNGGRLMGLRAIAVALLGLLIAVLVGLLPPLQRARIRLLRLRYPPEEGQ